MFERTHLFRAGDFLCPHGIGEYFLSFFAEILIKCHGSSKFILTLFDKVNIVSRFPLFI